MSSPAETPSEPALTLLASLALSLCAYKLTHILVPLLGPNLVAKGLGGMDMLKPGFVRHPKHVEDGISSLHLPEAPSKVVKPRTAPTMLPEATGVIGAAVYILLLSLFAPLPYLSHLLSTTSSTPFPSLNITSASVLGSSTVTTTTVIGNQDLDGSIAFPHHSFATYLACLLSLLTATFLGFLDDLFDIRWRFKLPIPVIASVPLLVTYAAGRGVTDVVLPKLLHIRSILNIESTNGVLHLGWIYYIYMSMLSTFCTNSINILAGINGVEVGQALVIALSIALNDILYLSIDLSSGLPTPLLKLLGASDLQIKEGSFKFLVGAGLDRGSVELADRHLFSLYFMLPLIGVCFGLLKHNWYPARAFIGDTFCYFSGMAFAVVGILGHFSKTVLLFFIPQVFNFIYSLPQLSGVIPCPRHRLPFFNEQTGLLEPSWAVLTKQPKGWVKLMLILLAKLRLLEVEKDEKGTITRCSNFTILNLILVVMGPMKEDRLTISMLIVQAAGSVLAFGIRYGVAGMFYDASRR